MNINRIFYIFQAFPQFFVDNSTKYCKFRLFYPFLFRISLISLRNRCPHFCGQIQMQDPCIFFVVCYGIYSITTSMRRIIITNMVIVGLILGGTYIFDTTLTLGDFHGLVFVLYSAYGLLVLLAINLVTALVLQYQQKRSWAKACLISSGIIAGVLAIGYIITSFIS